jgi:hypothetical protein
MIVQYIKRIPLVCDVCLKGRPSSGTMLILKINVTGIGDGDDEAFHSNKVELRCTPRQMTLARNKVGGREGQTKRLQ